MSFSLLPGLIADSVTDLSPELLQNRGVRLLMLDFDNTLLPYTKDTPSPEVVCWLETIRQADIPICIVSNSRKNRVKLFCKTFDIPCITHARKPFSKGIRACLEKYRMPASDAALVGDQIFTDTLGANCAGVASILVRAIDNHNFWLKARHVLEKPFIYFSRKRRLYL